MWGLQAVQAVVNFKWNAWARYYLYCELACYLVWLLGFQVFTIIFQVLLYIGLTCPETEEQVFLFCFGEQALSAGWSDTKLLSRNGCPHRQVPDQWVSFIAQCNFIVCQSLVKSAQHSQTLPSLHSKPT